MSDWLKDAVPAEDTAKESHWMDEAIPADEPKPEGRGIGTAILDDVVVPAAQFVDKYTGAPSRAAVSAAVKGENPLSAFAEHFGTDPTLAPTGKDIAKQVGVSDKEIPIEALPMPLKLAYLAGFRPTISGAAGTAIDLAADWTNVLPPIATAKAVAKGAAGAGKVATKAAVKTGQELFSGAAKVADLATGTTAATQGVEKAGSLAKEAARVVERAKGAFEGVFSPKVQPAYRDVMGIAKRNGIDPSLLSPSIEFGPNSVIARGERVLREGPTGQPLLEKHAEGARQINSAIERNVSKLSGGTVLSEPEAGKLIRDSFFERSKQFFDGMDITYDKVQQYAPGLMVNREAAGKLSSAVSGLEKFAKGRVQRGITNSKREQGSQLLRAVQALRRGNGSFKQSVEALRDIGEVAFGAQNVLSDVPADVEKLRNLYGDISEALITTVRKDVSPEFADELVANNKAMSEYFGNRSLLSNAIGSKSLADEGVFRNLVLSGDTKKIEALKEILAPDQVNQLKGAFINSLIKRGPDGTFSFDVLYSALRAKKNIAEALFSPQELDDLGQLIRLGKDHGLSTMSSSGTGASNAFRDMMSTVPRALVDEELLNRMKARARGTTGPKAQRSAIGETGSAANDLIPTVFGGSVGSRTGLENRLKALQSVGPSLYNGDRQKKRRLRALGE